MTDLYDAASRFPRKLLGELPARSRRDLRAHGLSHRVIGWRVKQGRMVHVSRDSYLAGGSAPDLLDRIHATLLVMPPSAVIGFHTAAALHGFGVLRSDVIHVVVPAGSPVPQRRGVAAHESVLPIEVLAFVRGVPCTPPARTAVYMARTVRRRDALPILDAALRSGATSEDELRAETARHERLRGVRQVRELVALADPRAECRQESHLRLLLNDAGLRGFVPQVVVPDEFGFMACRIDLADAATKTGLEYDGASHVDRHRARADRSRHNWLATRGWEMRYFTDLDLYRRPDYLVHVATDAQRRSRRDAHD